MKIGTDAMVLGAFASAENQDHILDIGAGTGVLSLMLAQKAKQLDITSVEFDAAALEDLQHNFEKAPFDSVFRIVQKDFNTFLPDRKFDVIISNPPFYKNSFTAGNGESRSKARNEEHLTFDALISKSAAMLNENGKMYLIAPYSERITIMKLSAENKLFVQQEIIIHGKPGIPSRSIFFLTNKKVRDPEVIQFTIRDSAGNYTNEYIELTKEFHSKDLRS